MSIIRGDHHTIEDSSYAKFKMRFIECERTGPSIPVVCDSDTAALMLCKGSIDSHGNIPMGTERIGRSNIRINWTHSFCVYFVYFDIYNSKTLIIEKTW